MAPIIPAWGFCTPIGAWRCRPWGIMKKTCCIKKKPWKFPLSGWGENHRTTLSCHNNLAMVYRDLDQFDQARIHFLKALGDQKKIGESTSKEVLEKQLRLSRLEERIGNHEKAKNNYRLLAKAFAAIQDDWNLSNTYFEMASLYANTGDWAGAIDYYQKTLELLEQGGAMEEYHQILVLTQMAWAYHQSGLGQLADDSFARAQQLIDQRRQHSPESPGAYALSGDQNIITFHHLKAKRALQIYRETKQLNALHDAREDFEVAFQKYSSWRRFLEEENSRLNSSVKATTLAADALPVYQLLFEKTGDLTYIDQAFELTEQAKNQSLQEKIRQFHALDKSRVPESLLAEELRSKQAIQALQAKIDRFPVQENREQVEELQQWQAELFAQKKNCSDTMNKLPGIILSTIA